MLSTELSIAALLLTALSALAWLVLAWWVWKLAKYCDAAVDFVANQNQSSVSLRRIADVESTLTELTDSYDALLTSHKKLRSRISMRENRERGKQPVDSTTEAGRLALKDELRDKAKAKGLLR